MRFGTIDICILELYLELIMSACGQQTDKRRKRAHNPFTTEEKLWLLNLAEKNPKMIAIDPDEFDVSVVRSMENVTRQLARQIRNRTQSTLQQLWQR
jgi:hypothetical protein